MFKIVLLLCSVYFGLVNSQIFGKTEPSLCNASYLGKEWQLSSTFAGVVFQNQNDSETAPTRRSVLIPPDLSSWSDFPVLPLVFATSNTLPEGRCKEQVQRYLQDLANSTLWAVQMFDASSKYPDGIIYGHTRHLGNFDQCYNLRAKLPPYEDDPEYEDEVEGRYCLIRFQYQRKNVVPTTPEYFTLDFDPNLSAWDAIEDKGDFRRVNRQSVYMALCVPASCSAEEVAAALSDPLKKLADERGIRLKTTVKPSLCQARSDLPKNFSRGAKVLCFIIAALFVLVIGSSWYDSSTYSVEDVAKETDPQDIFLCFSARRNLRSIFVATESHAGLECIHLIRFFFMFGVIVGHRVMQYYGYSMAETTYLEKMYTVRFAMIVLHGPIVVDGFFSIGGLLLAYGLLELLDRTKCLNFAGIILVRFFRLTPLYMLVVFFHVTLLPLMGSGPYWESWYLSVDYHLHIMGLLVLWIFWRLPRKLGYPFLASLIAIGIAIPCVITYLENLQPIFRGLPFMTEVRKDPYFVNQYIKTHTRIGPYMVGILAGAIIYDHKGSSWRLSKALSRILFLILAVGLTIASQSQGAKYFDPNSVLHPLETAAYAGFHRVGFAIGTCSIVVLITIGDGLKFHYNFMTPRWVPPLARLTYGAFLIHNINQGYDIGVTRTPRVFTIRNGFWDVVPDIVYTFTLSLLLSITVEGPIRKIEKFMLSIKRPRKSPTQRSSSNGIKESSNS